MWHRILERLFKLPKWPEIDEDEEKAQKWEQETANLEEVTHEDLNSVWTEERVDGI